MIDDGIGFQLVPWQPVLEKRIGQHITGIMRDAGGIEWSFGRKRGWGYECPQGAMDSAKPSPACRHGAGPAPSRKGWRVPRPRFAACGLDRMSPARQGLAKRLA